MNRSSRQRFGRQTCEILFRLEEYGMATIYLVAIPYRY